MNEFLERQIQRRIYNIIIKNPGIHITRIAELLNMPINEIEQHLKHLEQNKSITISIDEGYRRYYSTKEVVGDITNQILETRQKIYELILRNPGLHQAKIAQMLSMRKSLAEYHLQYLEKNNAIVSIKKEGYRRYFIKDEDVDNKDKQILSVVGRSGVCYSLLDL